MMLIMLVLMRMIKTMVETFIYFELQQVEKAIQGPGPSSQLSVCSRQIPQSMIVKIINRDSKKYFVSHRLLGGQRESDFRFIDFWFG